MTRRQSHPTLTVGLDAEELDAFLAGYPPFDELDPVQGWRSDARAPDVVLRGVARAVARATTCAAKSVRAASIGGSYPNV
jgi:hypothetical protein